MPPFGYLLVVALMTVPSPRACLIFARSAPTSEPVFERALAGVSNLALRKWGSNRKILRGEAGGALAESSDKREFSICAATVRR
jgi:hypothetical protein